MRDNPFKIQERMREQHLKERPASSEAASTPDHHGVLELKARKRRKQTYTVYLDKELMARVQRLARQKDVAASAVIEACIQMSLEQLEG